MNNAFTILGAEPTDNAERLQELLDEKELLLDDISEVQSAYTDLTNPKKRVQHEIDYFCREALDDFYNLVNHTFMEVPTQRKIAQIIVELGRWIEADNDELFTTINDVRSESGFTLIDDIETVSQSVQTLKQDCLQSINTYFDGLKEDSLVGIFNQIVKIPNYESFFIDELMSYFELTISETLKAKEDKCLKILKDLNLYCLAAFGTNSIPSLTNTITNLRGSLKDWDIYAQPLQVNMQLRGGQHKSSADLARVLRNAAIDISNSSQEFISSTIEDLSYKPDPRELMGAYESVRYKRAKESRDKLPVILPDSIKLTDQLVELIDLLYSVFAELEIIAELLKNDKKGLLELRATLVKLNNDVQEAKREGERRAQLLQSQLGGSRSSTNDSCCNSCCGCYVATCVYGSYDCPEVWTLRRYRDKMLGSTWHGRLFIRLYYAISPTIVKWFGKTKWFTKMWKGVLDKKVQRLQAKGFEDTPYEDIDWKNH